MNPTNHALVFSSWVPVFPADGLSPSSGVRRAVPRISDCLRMATCLSATSLLMTCTPFSACWKRTRPVPSSIFSMKNGSWCMPPFAIVCAPDAMSNALSSFAPVEKLAYGQIL